MNAGDIASILTGNIQSMTAMLLQSLTLLGFALTAMGFIEYAKIATRRGSIFAKGYDAGKEYVGHHFVIGPLLLALPAIVNNPAYVFELAHIAQTEGMKYASYLS
jgi:hypothetical protein